MLGLAIGGAGAPLVLLAVWGAASCPTDRQEAAHERPGNQVPSFAWSLIASVGSLVVIHTLIPHKEFRYLLPAMFPLAVLLGLGAGRLAEARGPAGGLAVALSLGWMTAVTFVLPGLGGSDRSEGDEGFVETPLHLWPSGDDHGIGALVTHPSLKRSPPATVLSSLTGPRSPELLTFLNWELYGRNAHPVLSLPNFSRLDSPETAYDLDRATHLILNRPLVPKEEEVLARRGFTRQGHFRVAVPLQVRRYSLWARPSPGGFPAD